MGSPAYFARLVNFTAAERKNAFIPFGLFNAADATWLKNVVGIPGFGSTLSQATETFSSTLAIDSSAADVITVVLTANVTSMTINYAGSSTIPTGQRFWLRLVENSTGGWTCALPSNLNLDTGWAIDTRANRATVLPIQYNGVHWIFFEEPFSVPVA